jgi:tetratricopeptide (TPR) repeat protein
MEEIDALLETATAHELRGGRALEKGDISAAAGHFRKAVELAPDEPAFHHKLATALALSGDSNGALQRLEDVVERWPTFAKAHHSIGLILLTLGRHGDAIHRFTSAVTIDPMDIAARLRLAEVLRASGRFEASLFHYEQVTEHDPRVADAGFGHAMALVGLMRYRGARDDLDLAMSVFPDRDGFSHAAARLLAAAPDDQVRDGRRALAIVKALVGARETSIPLAETMAMALAEVGQYGEAVRWQQDAIDTATKTGFTYLLPRLIGNLRLYEHGQPCRTPWGDEVAVATL